VRTKQRTPVKKDTTDITLFVRTSNEDVVQWNRQKIVDALLLETYVDGDTAEAISREVEKQIFSSGIATLTAPLIRELVNARLIERGLEHARRAHARLGFPLYDIGNLIAHRNRENANVPHWPEGTNLTLALGIKREYALNSVFSQDVSDAHLSGDFHLHNLGYIDRPYCSAQSLEHIKEHGIDLPNLSSRAKPARHAEVLLAHMVRFSAALQGNFAGPIEWKAVNVCFAPYITGWTDEQVRQLVQMLIFEFSQLAVSRGGQVMYTNLHVHWDIPDETAARAAIGPGGIPTGRKYGEYVKDARRLAWAMMEVYLRGDAGNKPFFFPKPVLHVSASMFREAGAKDFLRHACNAAADKGNPFFVLDRTPPAGEGLGGDERSAAVHMVTLNLPRIGYRSKNDDARLFHLLSSLTELAARAHAQKRDYMKTLQSHGKEGPLAFCAMDRDGSPYLDYDNARYLLGFVGLNELVKMRSGGQARSAEEALRYGKKILSHLGSVAGKLGRRYGIRLSLACSPAETTAYRFARLDLRYHSPEAGRHISGDLVSGGVYYSGSITADHAADVMTRLHHEGAYHPLAGWGAVSHVWLGSAMPRGSSLVSLMKRVFRDCGNTQLTFSPDFTCCRSCLDTSRGFTEKCPKCGSEDVDGITKIAGYFAWKSSLNRGKLEELRRLRPDVLPDED